MPKPKIADAFRPHPSAPEWARHMAKMLRHLHVHLMELQMTVDEFKQQFNDALTEATQIKDEMGSVKTLLDGLVEQINTLQNQVLDLQSQIANGGGDTQALVDSLAENMGALKESLDDTNQVAGQILAGTNADPGQPVVASVAKRKAAKTGTKPDVKTSTSKS